MTCNTCKYWEHYREGVGVCKRFPPVFTQIGQGVVNLNSFKNTQTSGRDWCGEWKGE